MLILPKMVANSSEQNFWNFVASVLFSTCENKLFLHTILFVWERLREEKAQLTHSKKMLLLTLYFLNVGPSTTSSDFPLNATALSAAKLSYRLVLTRFSPKGKQVGCVQPVKPKQVCQTDIPG